MANSTLALSRNSGYGRTGGRPLLSTSYRGSGSGEKQRQNLRSGKKGKLSKRGASPPIVLPGKVSPKDGRVYLNKCSLKTLDALGPHQPRLEFFYARDNYLRSFQGLGYMPVLKILDVSSNCLESLEFLGVLPSLRELYLNANMLTTLDDLPTLPNLEVLSVCQNEIESLRFMQPQPELRAFFVSHNHIKSLDGFPAFPNIESLRTTGNPLEENEQFALTAVIACGDTLRKLNGLEISPEDVEIASSFSAVASIAIRYGWMVGDGDAHQYLFEMQQEECLDSPLQLLKAEILGYVQEGCELVAQMSFKWNGRDIEDVGEGPDEASGLYFDYQWLRGNRSGHFQEIPNACMKTYQCGPEDVGYSLKVECTPVINLEEDEFGETVFAVTDTVAPAEPTALECAIVGVLREGETVRAHTAYAGGKEGNSLFSWFRCPPNASPELIVGAEAREYTLQADDVDCTLRVEYTPVRDDEEQGEPILGPSGVIQAAAPSVTDVHVVGELLENTQLTGYGDYFGGIEGESEFQWYRSEKNSYQTFIVIDGATEQVYTPSARDVNRRLKFEYTPVDEHGEAGLPSSAITTEVIVPCPPSINNLRIEGDFEEAYPLNVVGDYFGGMEGKSQIQWWRRHVSDNDDDWEYLPDVRGKKFVPTLEDIDFLFRVEYVPVRSDGKLGTARRTKTTVPVQPTEPRVKDMVIYGDHGEYMEGVMLEASVVYIGGIQGTSTFAWYRSMDENFEHYEVIEGTNGCMTYIPTYEDVDRVLKFKYYPVREDGVHGVEESVYTPEIQQGLPKYHDARIGGKFYEKCVLSAEGKYFGGREGPTELKWWRVKHNGRKQCIATDVQEYALTTDDVGCEILLMIRPVREDGVRGEWVITPKTGKIVLPALPTIEDLSVTGDLTEGSLLNVVGTYYGGAQGDSTIKWYRIDPLVGMAFTAIHEGATYTVEAGDMNKQLRVDYTPVRYDGVAGETVSYTTEVIHAAKPAVVLSWDSEDTAGTSRARGDPAHPVEGLELVPSGQHKGGRPSPQQIFAWYHATASGEKRGSAIATTKSYTPTKGDIGEWLLFEWVPVREDGTQGDAATLLCGSTVAEGPPMVTDAHIAFERQEISAPRRAVVTYSGGTEGASKIQWFRVKDGTEEAIPGATQLEYTPQDDDVSTALKFSYTPVRQDGLAGETVTSEISQPLMAGPPKIFKLAVVGVMKERERLSLNGSFFGTETTKSRFQWFADGKAIEKNGTRSYYSPVREDIGKIIACQMTPVDKRGVEGEPFTAEGTKRVEQGEPVVMRLQISSEDEPAFNQEFQVKGKYSGGKKGKCIVQWFRHPAQGKPTDETKWQLIEGINVTGYTGTADDFNHWLKCSFTPVRVDGVRGPPVEAIYKGPRSRSKENIATALVMDKPTKSAVERHLAKEQAEFNVVSSDNKEYQIVVGQEKVKVKDKAGKTVDKGSYVADFPKITLGRWVPGNTASSREFTLSLSAESTNTHTFLADTPNERDIIALTVRQAVLQRRTDMAGAKK